jgi:uncharacterized protein (TIGR02679 family)
VTDPEWAVGLDPLLRECHRRLGAGAAVTRVRLGPLTRTEQDAVADLLGLANRPQPGAQVTWTRVERAVEELTGSPLSVVLEDLYGPAGNRSADRARAADAREAVWDWLRGHDVVHRRDLTAWAAEQEAVGLRGSIDETRAVLTRALAVLDALPSAGEPLPVFAGRILNDTHALDGGSGLAGLVLSGIAARQGVARPSRAAHRRALWQSVGIADDALSATVLIAGFDVVGTSPADSLCRLAHQGGRALCLTLADLRDGLPRLRRAQQVWIVENPAILALAVHRFGQALPPMVCGSGWPSTAATTLLSGLSGAGHTLSYHGDLDGEGVRIAAHVVAESGARPWRMTTADYLANVADHGAGVGRVTQAPWDAELAPAMALRGVAVLEETVWESLSGDLAVGV